MASKAIWPCIKWPFILASAAVAYVLFLVLALVCIVFFTILLLLSPLLLLFKYFHPDYQQKEIPAREDEVLQERLHETGKRYDHVYLDAEVHGIRVRLHSIAIESRGKPIVVFVHGTAGSALGFTEALRQLCDRFSIHALDLPGFGRSTTEENRKVRKMPTPDLIRWYCDCLKLYIERCTDGHRVSILGHSFGGFLVVEFASFYPDMVEKLILVDSAGIYPILGRSGAYWSVFFSASLPQTFLRVCSYIGGDVLGHWVLSCYNASP
jgi:pimeloyl-ACP methyl ester carboxylesterase